MFKKVCTATILSFTFCFSLVLSGNESSSIYFPDTLDSYWVYEDQDGNEFKRSAVEGEEIGDEVLSAFSYEPAIENWLGFSYFFNPTLYKISDLGILFSVGNEVEKIVKARLQIEKDVLLDDFKTTAPPDAVIEISIDVKSQDQLTFLLDTVTENEEWDVNEYDAKITMDFSGGGFPDYQVIVNYQISETGIVLEKETLEVPAGIFEDCIKVEFRSETTYTITPPLPAEEVGQPGEAVTTLWLAQNIGIVRFHQEWNYKFLDMVPDDALPKPPDPKPITYELKKFEIKNSDTDNDEGK